MKPLDQLALDQVERRLKPLRQHMGNTRLRTGWVHYMRTALGMSLKNLAQRAGISVPTAAQSEKRENQGKVTLETLRKMAAAMDCELVYAFVPKKTFRPFSKKKPMQKQRESYQKQTLT